MHVANVNDQMLIIWKNLTFPQGLHGNNFIGNIPDLNALMILQQL